MQCYFVINNGYKFFFLYFLDNEPLNEYQKRREREIELVGMRDGKKKTEIESDGKEKMKRRDTIQIATKNFLANSFFRFSMGNFVGSVHDGKRFVYKFEGFPWIVL